MKSYAVKLEEAKSLADIFELVKEGVRRVMRTGRAGLTLGLAELGGGEHHWVGAFYPVGSNTIIMNKVPLRRIVETDPRLYNAYVFHVLLHEYLHSLGYIDEQGARNLVLGISQELFGKEHVVTQMAHDITRFLPNLTYPTPGYFQRKLEELEIEAVKDFDRSSVNYIV
ncbi:MAG: hypothetical protein EFT35_09815 [Methanophagales archaeon ANME-1-THS]|nr:MAG: hypothetical protein EFT35_09815 [Methanophagales archaeon ANME-1-THS]